METGSRTTPLLLTLVVVTSFVFLVFWTATDNADAREGDPLVILIIPEMGPGDVCRDTFTIADHYDSVSLNYRFQLAIKPRIALEDPTGQRHAAHVDGQNLTLEIDDPMPGEWTLNVTIAETPGLATGIRNGEVFILGFPETPMGGSRPSICHRGVAQA